MKNLVTKIIDNFYDNAQHDNIRDLTLDDLADASYPTIGIQSLEPQNCTISKENLKTE